MELSTIKDVQASAWEELKEKKIYFGHQSVGNNIIDGLKDWGRQKPEVKLRIIRLQDSYKIDSPGLYQASIGKNEDPRSKIDAFVAAMRQGIGNSADIAFFKFCFVDINSGWVVGNYSRDTYTSYINSTLNGGLTFELKLQRRFRTSATLYSVI